MGELTSLYETVEGLYLLSRNGGSVETLQCPHAGAVPRQKPRRIAFLVSIHLAP